MTRGDHDPDLKVYYCLTRSDRRPPGKSSWVLQSATGLRTPTAGKASKVPKPSFVTLQGLQKGLSFKKPYPFLP